ncbi:winged helix DNA-binding domain-containing protein [Phycicoccus sp. SLBN-51]|uniref:winged helix DNA-binding domain-containing protein n=1 Tax=Phycicoccus sp. SLBN-51 TaxID=2768447 RepID=UPI00114FD759|nr:winged helix DNA-binding domain-containing protein [Phycicoccus sp. SLBN-51]TQJ50177.1 winged helix DNA-binding protein [Phycicoccus sp. SLBN-51]
MDRSRVLRRRLATQRLSSAPLPSATDVVRLLTCVQSQERDHAFFSLGLRSRSATYAAVRAELDRGTFVRTHILRPTWHFVAAEDLRWVLAATSERVIRGMAGRHAQVGLDDPRHVGRSLDVLTELLSGRTFPTRAEIAAEFDRHGGLPARGEQLSHLVLLAELRGMVCSGPMRGVHHTYALVDEVVPPSPAVDLEEARARLAQRFFAGHGPAAVKDFTRWASLTIADATAAVAACGDALEQVEVEGVPHWYDPTVPSRTTAARAAYLLPVYDEVVLTYPTTGFVVADGHPNVGGVDPFWAPVVVDNTDVGLWKRTVGNATVAVEVRLAPSTSEDQRALVRGAAERLAAFVGKELAYTEAEGRPKLWREGRGLRAAR